MLLRPAAAAFVSVVLITAIAESGFAEEKLPRIEDFRLGVAKEDVARAQFERTKALAAETYLWGLPAFLHYRQTTEIKQARLLMAPDEESFGSWVLLRNLATPADKNNVMPNVDTLYGAAYLLLDKQGPAVLSLPAIKDRYYSVAMHDAYFNTFAVAGTRTTDGQAANVLILPPNYTDPIPAGFDSVVRAPTSGIALFQRIYTRDPSDVPLVRELQNQITLSSLLRWQEKKRGFDRISTPEFDAPAPVRDTRDPIAFFDIVSRHTCRNPPPADYAALTRAFAQVGLGPCTAVPDAPQLQAALRAGAGTAQDILDAAISTRETKNGWVVPAPATGVASPDYLTRAVVQITQVASFPPDEAMYFVGTSDADGAPLDGKKSYSLTFAAGQLPPVDPRAFWSLTMYDAGSNLLVDNQIKRYILRPTTPGLMKNEDGSLTLYMAHAKPNAVPEGNWLPAPAGGFIVVLRTYLPDASIQRGQWFPPSIWPLV